MEMVNLAALVCSENHCFDLSRRGYVNFLNHSLKTKYDKSLFESRRMIWESGFFEQLHKETAQKMKNELTHKNKQINILDAGCGEGSFLSEINKEFIDHPTIDLLGIGMDITKEGINIAARDYSDSIWCVADIVNCPFKEKQFHFILNILSPSNYGEFKRLLADDGIIIKVIPERYYLKELRDVFHEYTNKKVYSNQKTVDHFKKHFKIIDVSRIQYERTLNKNLLISLIQMTPLSWKVPEGKIQQFFDRNVQTITVDLTILVGIPY